MFLVSQQIKLSRSLGECGKMLFASRNSTPSNYSSANKLLPDFIVLDSIQTIQSENLDSAPEYYSNSRNVHLNCTIC